MKKFFRFLCFNYELQKVLLTINVTTLKKCVEFAQNKYICRQFYPHLSKNDHALTIPGDKSIVSIFQNLIKITFFTTHQLPPNLCVTKTHEVTEKITLFDENTTVPPYQTLT